MPRSAASTGARRSPARTSMVNSTAPGMTLTAPGSVLSIPTVPTVPGVSRQIRSTGEYRLGRGGERVAPQVHGNGSRVARPPHHLHPTPCGAGDGGHHTHRQVFRFEHRSLLDVHLDVRGHLVPVIARLAHRIRIESERAHRLVKAYPVLVDGGQHGRVETTGHGLAADERRLEPQSFLISECDHIDRG